MKKCPFCAEEIQEEAIKCKHCGERLEGGAPEIREKVVADGRPSFAAYWKGLALSVLFLLAASAAFFSKDLLGPFLVKSVFFCAIAADAVLIGYILLDRSGRHYLITSRRVIARSGILSKNIDEVNIAHIRSINVRQTLVERIFDCGDIFIGTAGTAGIEVTLRGIARPRHFKELIAGQNLTHTRPLD